MNAGAMTQNPFYWPANLPTSQTLPLSVEETVGFGGGGIGMNAGGPLPVGQLPSTSYAVAPAADGGLTGDGSTVPTGGIQPILRESLSAVRTSSSGRTPTGATRRLRTWALRHNRSCFQISMPGRLRDLPSSWT